MHINYIQWCNIEILWNNGRQEAAKAEEGREQQALAEE